MAVVVAVFGGGCCCCCCCCYDIHGAYVQSACFALIVGITPGKCACAILAAYPLPLRPLAIRLARFQLFFTLFVSLWERETDRTKSRCQREEGRSEIILSYLTADLASFFVSKFASRCERGYGDYGGCCLLVRVNMRHWSFGVQELGLRR